MAWRLCRVSKKLRTWSSTVLRTAGPSCLRTPLRLVSLQKPRVQRDDSTTQWSLRRPQSRRYPSRSIQMAKEQPIQQKPLLTNLLRARLIGKNQLGAPTPGARCCRCCCRGCCILPKLPWRMVSPAVPDAQPACLASLQMLKSRQKKGNDCKLVRLKSNGWR